MQVNERIAFLFIYSQFFLAFSMQIFQNIIKIIIVKRHRSRESEEFVIFVHTRPIVVDIRSAVSSAIFVFVCFRFYKDIWNVLIVFRGFASLSSQLDLIDKVCCVDCILSECFNFSLAVSMDDFSFGAWFLMHQNKWQFSWYLTTKGTYLKTNARLECFICICVSTFLPRNNFTLTAYETMMPNASRLSGVARLKT